MPRLALLLLLAGCNAILGIEEERPRAADASPPDGRADAPPDPPSVAHLAAAAAFPGEGEVVFTAAARIDTTSLQIDGGLPTGVILDVWPQLADGSEVAVLHVAALTLAPEVVVDVTGARPLVIVSGGDIAIGGTLDAGAHATLPGPGASPTIGAGGSGVHEGAYLDGGGGGGGHGEDGGAGGNATFAGLTACTGNNVGDLASAGMGGSGDDDAALERLVGGSVGGAGGSSCPVEGVGGAGGGALQLSSFTRISVSGLVRAGGGGGRGGVNCGSMDASAGGGGGAGGSLYLEAPEVSVSGTITANGGGGGSGGSNNEAGNHGADAGGDAFPAEGGPAVDQFGGAGATGGARDMPPGAALPAPDCGNGGGGGGAVGRVVVRGGTFVETGVVSPAAVRRDAR